METCPLKILEPLLSTILVLIPHLAIQVAAISLRSRQTQLILDLGKSMYPAGPAPTINTSTSECPGAISNIKVVKKANSAQYPWLNVKSSLSSLSLYSTKKTKQMARPWTIYKEPSSEASQSGSSKAVS